MPAIRQVYPKFKAWNHAAKIPLAGGKVYTYINGSTVTTKDTWSNRAKSVLNANPVVLDPNGEANIFLDTDNLYTFVIRDSADVLVEQIDDVGFLMGAERGAVVYNLAVQSIPDNVSTAMAWTQELRDVDNIHSASGSRLTIPNGIVQAQFLGAASFAVSAVGIREVEIKKNGASLTPECRFRAINAGASVTTLQVSTPKLVVVPGDYFELFVLQNSGGALNVNNTGSWFSAEFSR